MSLCIIGHFITSLIVFFHAATGIWTGVFTASAGPITAFRAARQGGVDHCRGTADPAFHLYGHGGAVQQAGTAFHAGLLIDEHRGLFASCEDPMGTDLTAHAAVGTFLLDIFQRILLV